MQKSSLSDTERRKVTPVILAEMKALRKAGWSYRKIAEKFKVAHSTAIYHLASYEGKTGKIMIQVWMREKFKKKIEDHCEPNDISLSAFIRLACREKLNRDAKET